MVVKTWGLKGQVKVYSYAASPDSFRQYPKLLSRKRSGPVQPVEIDRIFQHKNMLVIKFKGIDRVDLAEELVNSEICVPKQDLESLPEGEFYWHELIGLKVIDERGASLGTLKVILPTGANDVYVVQGDEGEILVPATWEVVLEVDAGRGIMIVRLPEVM